MKLWALAQQYDFHSSVPFWQWKQSVDRSSINNNMQAPTAPITMHPQYGTVRCTIMTAAGAACRLTTSPL